MTEYPLHFYGWQPSAEGGCGVTKWELPRATCPRTKGVVPWWEVVWKWHTYPWGVVHEPICKRCKASLMEQAYPVDELEQRALLAKHKFWKGLRKDG